MNRTEKFYGFRLQRAREKLEEDEATLNRLASSRDPDERRILPVWEKRVQDDRSRIQGLEHARQQELAGLEARRKVGYSFRLINAALIHAGKRE